MTSDELNKTKILLLGPDMSAVSGVSTHLNQLFASPLPQAFDMSHFQVGSVEEESKIQKAFRLLLSPALLAVRIVCDRPDIVHINASLDQKSFPRDGTYLAVARLLRRKVIFQVHGGDLPLDLYASRLARTQFVARVLRAAQVVVVLAQSELEAYNEFLPEIRLQIIPNAVQLDPKFEFPQEIASGPLRLVYVGRLVSAKGVSDLITAAYLLRDSGRDFQLTIAGTGPEKSNLMRQARDLIQDKKVEFVGAVFGDEKTKLWRDSHISISPTSHHEGLPYSLLESMGSGTVPITTRVGAQPDVMTEGVHGLFVRPHDPAAIFDAVARLDDDRRLLLSMSQRSTLRVRDRYTIKRLGSEFSQLYRSLAASGSSGKSQ